MAKKPKSSAKSAKKQSSKKQSAKQQAREDAAVRAKQVKADRKAAKRAAESAPPAKADQVAVLKLALRDTEAKLVDAEHRLRQVQQQLDDERRALAEAAAEAVVDAAVAETVAEAVAEAELVVGDEDPAVVAEVVAETLEEVAAEAELEPDDAGGPGAPELTPPLPTVPPDDVPNEGWTLVRLREEAHRRGVTGVSGLSKARLIERLTQG